ncbi:MAG: PTS sugar transporter subunit IIC [Staphylococcus equorum]|nr:PTS sugar transporter subunit IIC [Staphylococcus equorum]
MDVILGIVLLFAVLAFFTIFNYRAPQGSKAMGALASAACASFLVEAFHSAFLGDLVGIEFLGEVGAANGSAGGVAAAILVPLALGVAPVYAVLVGLSVAGMGILPGFIAGYLISFVVQWLEEKIPDGLDLIVIILIAAPLSRLIAVASSPMVDATLLQIGEILVSTADSSPVIMGVVLGGVLTVVATAPLSSMALTALLGLTGTPMAIGALAVFGSSFMNYVLFSKMKFGDKKDTISVAIEPLTQTDIISANPIPVYVTNFIGGASSGLIISLMGLVNNTPGTATPIAGFAVMFAYNPAGQVLIAAAGAMLVSIAAGYLGSYIFSDYDIVTADQVRNIGLKNI